MMNLFKTKEKQHLLTTPIQTIEKPKEKTTNELIEEIHESFFTEVDKLLEGAKVSKSLETNKQDLINKQDRLVKLGFLNSKEVKDAKSEIDRLESIKKENDSKKDIMAAIEYFSVKYPTYKFITEESVKRICEKYGLVYGDVCDYLGEVPYKNLKHIEEFRVEEEDELYFRKTASILLSVADEIISFQRYVSQKEHDSPIFSFVYKSGLEIAAPIKDFDTSNMEVIDSKVQKKEIPDPVVLKPVCFNMKKYYLIVTAWGIESEDELVVNQINN